MSYWDGTRWIPDRLPTPVRRRPRSRTADWLATVIMLAGVMAVLFPGNPSEAAGPRLSAAPSVARQGDVLSISGSGFPAYSTVRLAWDGSISRMPSARVSSAGNFQSRVVVADATVGGHTVTALSTRRLARRVDVRGVSKPIASISVTVLASATAQAPVVAPPPITTGAAPPAATPTAEPTSLPTVVPTTPPTAPPPPPFVPTAGLPRIDPSYGTVFRKVFTDGTLTPFKKLTYMDDHIGQPGQDMTVYNRFSNATPTVHDGYLDLRATARSDGLWDGMLVGTSQQGNGPTFGYGVFRYWLSFNIGPATWQGAWLYDTTAWSATEIDFPEMLENQSLTSHVLGSGAGGRYGLPKPADLASVFHEFKVERRATFVAFSIDGVEVARINGAMPASKLAILLDTCVGHPWMGAAGAPSGSTPANTYLHVAAITVDP